MGIPRTTVMTVTGTRIPRTTVTGTSLTSNHTKNLESTLVKKIIGKFGKMFHVSEKF